jgi:MFS family permease
MCKSVRSIVEHTHLHKRICCSKTIIMHEWWRSLDFVDVMDVVPTTRRTVLTGLAGLAVAMGIGRFAFTPLLPLMQSEGLTLSQGAWLADANYLGYVVGALACFALNPTPSCAARAGLVAISLSTLGMAPSPLFVWSMLLRFAAGIASAFVLVGISAWALGAMAGPRRAEAAGGVYAGVGVGILAAGLVAMTVGLAGEAASLGWWLVGGVAAAVTAGTWRSLRFAGSPPTAGGAQHSSRSTLTLVACYGAFGFGYILPATFLPAMARELVADPAVFGWTWPIFGAAAAVSTWVCGALLHQASPRILWAVSQLVMAVGVVLPAAAPRSIGLLAASALCIGGTFMVVTMSGLQEARRVAGAAAPRMMAAMTAAFGTGQLIGPLLVGSGVDVRWAFAAAAGLLLLSSAALLVRPGRAADIPTREMKLTMTHSSYPYGLDDRLPPIPLELLDPQQRAVADELIAGPRKSVFGPFIPLLRSPELLARVQKVGEYLRFDSALSPRVTEFATLIVARHWTQQFEWSMHVPKALAAGTQPDSIASLREGLRPDGMNEEETCAHDFAVELLNHRGVSDMTYGRACERFGERGVVDLTGLIGYFAMVNMVLNVAHTPHEPAEGVEPLPSWPL